MCGCTGLHYNVKCNFLSSYLHTETLLHSTTSDQKLHRAPLTSLSSIKLPASNLQKDTWKMETSKM